MSDYISQNAVPEIVEHLQQVLADSFVVYFKIHSYHWNVVGPDFKPLHDLFGVQYTELWTAIDDIAERIRSLGSGAANSMAEMIAQSNVDEATTTPDAKTMVKELAQDQQKLCASLAKAVAVADAAGDVSTADLMTQRLNIHEKNVWMLQATLA